MNRQAIINAMRKEQSLARSRVQRARQSSVPMPAGGLNTRDDKVRIPPNQAERFTNLESARDGIKPIPNASIFASITSVSVEALTLMVHKGSSVEKLFVGAEEPDGVGKIWSVPPAGGAVATAVATGFSTGLLSWANVNGRLVVADGFTAQQSFDGTTWSNEPMSVAPGEPALNTDLLAAMYPFKNRVYWWRQHELGFWYSTLDTIGDALRYFDLSYVARKGGDLLKMTRYTHDGGAGPDDYPVFITSQGEAIVYQGTNPGDASSWALVGTFNLGRSPYGGPASRPQKWPLVAEWGANSWLITESDFLQLPQALLTEGVVQPSLLAGAVRDAFMDFGSEWGWEAVFYPGGPWLLFNVPQASATYGDWTNPQVPYIQYIINLETGAPSKMTHHNGRAWAVYNNELYFTALASTSGSPTLIKKAAAGTGQVSVDFLQGPTTLGKKAPKAIKAVHIWSDENSFGNHVPNTASATMQLATNLRDPKVDIEEESVLRIDEWVLLGGVGTYVQLNISGPVNINMTLRDTQYIWEELDPSVVYRPFGL